MKHPPVQISVIIPTYQDWKRLKRCLLALLKSEFDSFEVIVVNNANDEAPGDLIKEVFDKNHNITLLKEPKAGSYAARNKGIQYAKGDLLAFTDADCIPESNWLQNIAKHFEQNSDLMMIGGPIHQFKDDPGVPDDLFLFQKYFAFRQKDNLKKGWSVTANMIVRKTAIEAIGGFNETSKSGGDREFGLRVTSHYPGRTHYFEDVCVQHPVRPSLQEIYKKKERIVYGQLRLYRKRLFPTYFINSFFFPLYNVVKYARHDTLSNIMKVLNVAYKERFYAVKILFKERAFF